MSWLIVNNKRPKIQEKEETPTEVQEAPEQQTYNPPIKPNWAIITPRSDSYGRYTYIEVNYQQVYTLPLIHLTMRYIPIQQERVHPGVPIPQHNFWISETLITQSMYQTIIGKNPSIFSPKITWFTRNFRPKKLKEEQNKLDRPVENVSLFEAKEFCSKLSDNINATVRLPNEAEWVVCTKPHPSAPVMNRLGWYKNNSNRTTHIVGKKGKTDLGLHDMHGNVWEWCEDDWEENLQHLPEDGGTYVDNGMFASFCDLKVIRGGDIRCTYIPHERVYANLEHTYTTYGNKHIGFRIVIEE